MVISWVVFLMDKTTYTDRYDNEISRNDYIRLKDIEIDKAVWLEIYKAVIIRDVHQTKVVRITDEYFDAYKERWAE